MSSLPTTNIVVVDDDEDSAVLLRELLERRGYRAVALTSADACLEYLRGGAADVVITDIQMPDVSGIDLCRELGVRHPDLLAIVLTGVANREHLVRARHAGAYDLITKPAKAEVLELAIQRALTHRAVRREASGLRIDPTSSATMMIATAGVQEDE
jgi:DNA-binding NtrC family response regulator